MSKLKLGLGSGLVLGVLGWVWHSNSQRASHETSAEPGAREVVQPPASHRGLEAHAPASGLAPPPPALSTANDPAPLRERRAAADEFGRPLRALGYGRGEKPTAPQGQAPAARMPSPVGSGNQAKQTQGEYIQSVVREQFKPVAGSCYEELLERDPNAAGQLVLAFNIVGNAELGGVVEEVQVEEAGTTLKDEEFTTCMRESMYTTTFAAPPDGAHTITITYPFSFAP